ncbi:hypothetical protein PAHAL_1G282700 [Panicum hallii]|uniref:Uncharacterized protein n=1 Tax=Panicum hallii TaxID=206008 RepID=A0A2T8KWR6_9POAL|nr:hypothetical protein PAHAL_1G282700 [Panicum hallii]
MPESRERRHRWPHWTGSGGRGSVHASPNHEGVGLRDLRASMPQPPGQTCEAGATLASLSSRPARRRFADAFGLVRPRIPAAPRPAPARETPDPGATAHDSPSSS